MTLNFAYSRVQTDGQSYRPLYEAIVGREREKLGDTGIWGAFFGLFGLGSNELILMTTGDVSNVNERLGTIESVQSVETLYLEPTVRPTDYESRTREGLYVFRFFDVRNSDVEKIAQLSKTAWETFEVSDAYQAIPQALFCEQDRSNEFGKMLLCTWYDGLNSWQVSRAPAPEATENFRARAQLTLKATPYATRLIVE
ncbi:MAG: hypothetical protein OXG25_14660 [Gammaproteobacteria bacterium]|nr:hypothetical protein [Gammaproteobacteria bacterium]